MYNSNEKNAYYYLRSLPFFSGVLLFLIFLWANPELVRALGKYISYGPEENFARYGWYLYYLIIPFCVSGLSRVKYHWPMVSVFMLAPIVLCLSYWLWELLGWVVMGIYLIALVTILDVTDKRRGKEHDIYKWTVIATCGIYAVLRVIGGLFASDILGFIDFAFVIAIGGYFMLTSIVDCFKSDEDLKFADIQPSSISFLYILIILFLMILMAGIERSKPQRSSAKQTNQQTTSRKATTYVCTASTLNIRNMPNSSARTLGKLKKGEKIEVYQFVNDYAEINYAGQKGYVSKKYLTTVDKYKASSSTSSSYNKKAVQTTSSQTQQIKPVPADARQLHAGRMTSKPRTDDSGRDNIYAVTQGSGYITVWFVIPRFNTFEVSSRTYLTAQNGSQNIKLKVKEMGEWTKEKGYVKFKLDVHHAEDYSSDRLFGLIFDEIDPSITTITIKDEKRNWEWTGIHLNPSK